jgi:hypothetical protein
MALPPFRDHRISLADAAVHTRRHRDAAAKDTLRGAMFHGQPVRELLEQPGCVGLRIYHGRNADGTPAVILVGVDANGDDMTTASILEFHYPCPPYCPVSNDLNP